MPSLACALLIACRGEFDVDKYLVGDDEATSESASSESGSTGESGSGGELTGESTSDSTESTASTESTDSTDSTDSTTGVTCEAGEFDLGSVCLSVAYAIDLGSNAPTDFELGDIDSNDSLDIVLAGLTQISYRYNTGVGDFGPAMFVTGPGATALALGDIDGDGRLDLASFTQADTIIYLGSANSFVYDTMLGQLAVDGLFVDIDDNPGQELVLSGQTLRAVAEFGGAYSLAADLPYAGYALGRARIDADSRDDVLMATNDSSLLTTRNDGTTLTNPLTEMLGVSISAIAAADLDDDGLQEVALTATDGRLYLYNPANFDVQLAAIDVGEGPNAIAIGDIDGDSILDIAIANDTSRDVAVLLNTGGTLLPPVMLSTNNAMDKPESIAIGDLDDDNRGEIIVGMTESNRLIVFR